jgi:hypothetical protein
VINRRFFVQTAAVAAAGSLTVAPALADLPQMQRWDEQKWLLDDIIQSVGMDWDQGRSSVMIASLGPESQTDLNPDSPDDFAHPPLMRTGFAIIDK